jgi:GH35 family endo-1,4-beta-xylanase
LKDAVLIVKQTRHAFLFGCNIFLLDPRDSSAAQKTYQVRFTSLFSYATLPFYWGAFEKEKGRGQYERLELMAQWCRAHRILAKGHPLIWHGVYPKWAPGDPDEAIALLRERVKDIIEHYKGLITVWDVINEANIAPDFNNGEGRWVKREGPANVVRVALDWAREAGKGSNETFIYNDYNIGPENVALLTQLASSDSLPDAIGIQSHMHKETWPVARVWEVCETFARFGKPFHFTETTVISGPIRQFNYQGPPLKDWFTTTQEEARQADYVEKLYTVIFSHPSAQAITWWDLSDDRAWLGAPAGLLRRDMTAKPAYERLMSLIHKKWRTKVTGKTDSIGIYQSRVFLGSYEITVAARGKTRTLPAEVLKNGDENTVVEIKL